jgi:transcriptional regulator with XRE-family HTH domain
MKLGDVLRAYRYDRCNVRELAKEIGVPVSTLSRVENGHACDSRTLARILLWMLDDRRRSAKKRVA